MFLLGGPSGSIRLHASALARINIRIPTHMRPCLPRSLPLSPPLPNPSLSGPRSSTPFHVLRAPRSPDERLRPAAARRRRRHHHHHHHYYYYYYSHHYHHYPWRVYFYHGAPSGTVFPAQATPYPHCLRQMVSSRSALQTSTSTPPATALTAILLPPVACARSSATPSPIPASASRARPGGSSAPSRSALAARSRVSTSSMQPRNPRCPRRGRPLSPRPFLRTASSNVLLHDPV